MNRQMLAHKNLFYIYHNVQESTKRKFYIKDKCWHVQASRHSLQFQV